MAVVRILTIPRFETIPNLTENQKRASGSVPEALIVNTYSN